MDEKKNEITRTEYTIQYIKIVEYIFSSNVQCIMYIICINQKMAL